MFRNPLPSLIVLALFLGTTPFGFGKAHASVMLQSPFAALKRSTTVRDRYTIHGNTGASGITRMSGLETFLAGKLNEACLKSHITSLTFEALPKYASDTNFCEIPVASVPKDALALIEKVGELNGKVAALLGQDAVATFAMDVEITVTADAKGSLMSEAQGGRVYLSTLPDWTFQDFSSEIYAHEIIHTLTFNRGPTSEALLGLQDHPFLIEALPDLVSATIHDSPRMELGEKTLPECIRIIRNGTPTRSLDEPFSSFYTLSSADQIVKCCATLDLNQVPDFAKALCNQFTWTRADRLASVQNFVKANGISAVPYDDAHLTTAFEAEDCRITTNTGLTYLDNCDTHQFAVPLVSFFFRLKELTGKSWVTAFFGKIREGSLAAAVYECGYTSLAVTPNIGGAKAYVALRPLLGAFMALRESLSAGDQAAFDRAWKEHDFGKMMDLDRIYRGETLSGVAQLAVKAKNTLYRDLKGCDNPYQFDPAVCSVACEKKL